MYSYYLVYPYKEGYCIFIYNDECVYITADEIKCLIKKEIENIKEGNFISKCE